MDARASATEKLMVRGYRDRRSGAMSSPDDDAKEPARTERILASPFAFYRTRAGDYFDALQGFLLFRVHGATRFGVCFRLIVLCTNMLLGFLAGLVE